VDSDNLEIACIVTIHGIGFQQPPQPPSEDTDGKPLAGYADDLHMHLCEVLNTAGDELLSNDPLRKPYQATSSVPIYVESVWFSNFDLPDPQDGLERLGTWVDKSQLLIDENSPPLVEGAARIAHVALVYSELEGESPEWQSAAEAAFMALVYFPHYIDFRKLLDKVFKDTESRVQRVLSDITHHHTSASTMPSLQVRQDPRSPKNPEVETPPDSNSILNVLKNDVAAYVCHNGRRQRVRDFIGDALLRLAARGDVKRIVLNTHSNGTLIGIDVEQELPPSATEQISAIITASSPIRKYVDLFAWGKHLAVMPQADKWLAQWFNFWDPKDVVADPLRPWPYWKKWTEPTLDQNTGIYEALPE
jgi:hypothetical protein